MSELDVDARIERLAAAHDEVRQATAAIEEFGEDRVERVKDAHDRFDALLAEYRESASGSGAETFRSFVEFEGKLDEFVSKLPDDLPHRDAFEAAEDILDRRRLEERDFDLAREELAPAREVAEMIDEREAARGRYREARHRVEARRREVAARIGELESVLAFEDVDFDAPIERLREPIARYNEGIDEAFRAFLREEPARAVVDFLEATADYPLVEFEAPPPALATYLREEPPGEEPIVTLLEWTDFTRSKLGHFVDDPATFRATVGANRTYLTRLDASPLEVAWPPPEAEALRFRARELVAVADRFAPPEVVEQLHAVRRLPTREDYERLRQVATAGTALDDADRRRLQDGTVAGELDRLIEERDRLDRVLEEYSEP